MVLAGTPSTVWVAVLWVNFAMSLNVALYRPPATLPSGRAARCRRRHPSTVICPWSIFRFTGDDGCYACGIRFFGAPPFVTPEGRTDRDGVEGNPMHAAGPYRFRPMRRRNPGGGLRHHRAYPVGF